MTERTLKARAKNPYPTAFAFEHVDSPKMDITRISWTHDARSLLDQLRFSLRERDRDASLPVRDLRLRLQVRDAGVIRVDKFLGQMGPNRALLATTTPAAESVERANAAVALWVLEAVLALKQIDKDSASTLRRLALDGAAVDAHREFVEVFRWDQKRNVGTATKTSDTLFADLADYIAHQLAGKVIYRDTSPLRRVISRTLFDGHARLMTDPLMLPIENTEVQFSLGLTVRVATYPGRSLPVIIVSHHKHVWAREPEKGARDTSGYAFPRGEHRVFVFQVGNDLSLGDDYNFIARQYNLTADGINACELARDGRTSAFRECPTYIAHLYGQGEKNSAPRGVPDMDRLLSFERMATILEPLGIRPWTALREIRTHYGALKDADGHWKHAFTDPSPKKGADECANQKRLEEASSNLSAWVEKMRSGIDAHYDGKHHIVIAYANGYLRDAEDVKADLHHLLGEHTIIHLEAIPDDVHGPKQRLACHHGKPADRAQIRANAWGPFIATMREYMTKHQGNPVHGVLVLAPEWYDYNGKPAHDDRVNKRVARITLNRELGLTIQYLVPPNRKSGRDQPLNTRQLQDFRTRLVNAWRDMAWKSIGKMRGLDLKVQRSLQDDLNTSSMPVVLGVGVIRTNKRKSQQNERCFMPYAIELDARTGNCQAAVLLRQGNDEPRPTPMLGLRQLIKEITQNGPSDITRNVPKHKRYQEQAQRTHAFLYQIIAERAKLHSDLILLADMQTLKGLWPWLADSNLDPKNVEFIGAPHAEQDFRDVTIVRLRDDHAPKVLMDAPKSFVKIDGVIRPAAKWSDGDLYAIEDVAAEMPTYLSFGTRIFKAPRGVSSYLPMEAANGEVMEPYVEAWQTPSALEITVIRTPRHRSPEGIAKLVEALRSEYEHYGCWTKLPAPLFFASFLKEYVPDYELDDEEQEDVEEAADEDE